MLCWAGSTSLTQDFASIVYRMQLLGFNAIRLPFSFRDQALTPHYISYSCSQVQPARSGSTVHTHAPDPRCMLSGAAMAWALHRTTLDTILQAHHCTSQRTAGCT